jgi:hypothetical protein
MKTDNPSIESCAEIVTRRRAEAKAIDGSALVAHLAVKRKSDLKEIRRVNHFKAIPESHYESLNELGRAKYRAIVVATIMALLWDGWKGRKKTKRKPSNDVMVTRRMLASLNMSEATAGQALSDLIKHGIITVSRKSVYSGKSGKNLGTLYRLPWMEKKSNGKQLKIYWGLLVSDAFLALSVTLQAIIILLHTLHYRKRNRLTIRACALSKFGIHRTCLPKYVNQLVAVGFLICTDDYDFEFGWIDRDGKPDFSRLNKNPSVANSYRPCS